MREIQVGVSGKGSIEALISPFRPLAQYQRARPSFSELRHPPSPASTLKRKDTANPPKFGKIRALTGLDRGRRGRVSPWRSRRVEGVFCGFQGFEFATAGIRSAGVVQQGGPSIRIRAVLVSFAVRLLLVARAEHGGGARGRRACEQNRPGTRPLPRFPCHSPLTAWRIGQACHTAQSILPPSRFSSSG